MVLMFLAEVVLEGSLFAARKTYDFGYYMWYGTPETKEDIILRQIEELKKQTEELKKKQEEEGGEDHHIENKILEQIVEQIEVLKSQNEELLTQNAELKRINEEEKIKLEEIQNTKEVSKEEPNCASNSASDLLSMDVLYPDISESFIDPKIEFYKQYSKVI